MSLPLFLQRASGMQGSASLPAGRLRESLANYLVATRLLPVHVIIYYSAAPVTRCSKQPLTFLLRQGLHLKVGATSL